MFNIVEELKKLPGKPRRIYNERQRRQYNICGKSSFIKK